MLERWQCPFLHCVLASAQCIVIGPVCGCERVCVWVCYHDILKIVCIDPHQTGFVGKGSDHLQLIKFWPSCTLGRGSAKGQKNLAPPCYSQRTVFASLCSQWNTTFVSRVLQGEPYNGMILLKCSIVGNGSGNMTYCHAQLSISSPAMERSSLALTEQRFQWHPSCYQRDFALSSINDQDQCTTTKSSL